MDFSSHELISGLGRTRCIVANRQLSFVNVYTYRKKYYQIKYAGRICFGKPRKWYVHILIPEYITSWEKKSSILYVFFNTKLHIFLIIFKKPLCTICSNRYGMIMNAKMEDARDTDLVDYFTRGSMTPFSNA